MWLLVSSLPLDSMPCLVTVGPWVSNHHSNLLFIHIPYFVLFFCLLFVYFFNIEKEISDVVAAGAGSATTIGAGMLYRNRHLLSRRPLAIRPPLQYH